MEDTRGWSMIGAYGSLACVCMYSCLKKQWKIFIFGKNDNKIFIQLRYAIYVERKKHEKSSLNLNRSTYKLYYILYYNIVQKFSIGILFIINNIFLRKISYFIVRLYF